MKKGYTLAEVLITLGIIGILVAVMLPLINKARPVSEKSMYLKTYDSIVSTVHSLVNNKDVYPETNDNDNDNIDYSEYPLVNLAKATFAGQAVEGNDKLAKILKQVFNGNDSEKSKFTTSNGTEFEITRPSGYNDRNGLTGHFLTQVLFKLKDSKTEFKINIYADGKVEPSDEVGIGYGNTRVNLFKKGNTGTLKSEGDIKSNSEYELKCVSSEYTYNAAKNKCEEGGGEGCTQDAKDSCSQAGGTLNSDCSCDIPKNSCTAEKQNVQDDNCQKQNKVSYGECGGCGGCLSGYINKGGSCEIKTIEFEKCGYEWHAYGHFYYTCLGENDLEKRLGYFKTATIYGRTQEEAKSNLIEAMQENLIQFSAMSNGNAYISCTSPSFYSLKSVTIRKTSKQQYACK